LFPSPHAKLSAVIELEINLVHELSNKEYAPAVQSQKILGSSWIGKPSWIESGPNILDTHPQIAVFVHGNENVYRFFRIAVVAVNNGVGESFSYDEPDVLSVARQ
jgi:hypothetical protein